MNKIKSKLNNWEAYKNLRKNIQPSFVIVAIIFIIGVGSIAYFIPKGAGSAGPDPATPLDSSSAQRIKDAIAAGATSYKLLIYDNRPQELADAIVAGNGNISITLRGTGSLSGTDYANLVSQAFDIVQANTGKLANYVRPNKFFASCCSNEPEFNEPVDPIKEAGNYSEFIDQLRKNNDLDKFSQGWYVADVANSNYITYLTQFLEYAGKDALEADFVPINCYQNCISRFDGLVQIYSAIFANPQLYIYETAPWQDQGLTYDGLKDFVTKCSSSNNCIDVLLFNALKSNGEFNWHWNNVTPEQIADLYASGKFSFNNQGLSRTFRGYIQYLLTGDQIFLKDYEAFVKLFETNSKYYQTLYTGSNELYGISSASTNVSCANGTLTFDYAVNRSNKLTTVADVSLGISYVITNKDKSTSSGYLGGSSRYGGNLNRPGADDGTTGSIITLSQGDNDGINHSVSYGTNAVSIKIIADLGFNSQYGFNHHLNECTIDLTECSSSSAKVVCNGANPNSLYCSPHDDSIKNAPLKQPTDANVVGACKDNDSKATLSYKFKNDDAANYRLGFEITSPKGSQIVSALIQQYPDAKLNSSGEYTDNTSKMITQNLSTAPLKSTMSNGHVDVSLNGLESRLNYPGFLSQFNRDLTKDENIKFQTDVDAGIDKLEYLFELMCYLDSSLSPDQAPCNKILRDNNTPLTMAAYDDLSDYPFFANLRDQILSCNLNSNKQSYTGKNADMFVGGSGSYVSYFEITPEMIDPTNSTAIRKPTPTLTVETTPSLFIQRINWIVSSMLSDEKDFLTVNANEPALQKKLEEAYQACMLQAGEKYGSAAEVNYRLVLEKQEPLACPAGSIRMADYQWRRVATGKVGTAYIPGLALVYEFMSQLPTQTGSLVPGMTFRFNPSAENPCALILEK